MGKIVYNSDSIRNSASKISSLTEQLETNISKINGLVDEVQNAWTGSSGKAYINNLMEKQTELQRIVNKLKELPNCLNKIANSNDENQQKITSMLNSK